MAFQLLFDRRIAHNRHRANLITNNRIVYERAWKVLISVYCFQKPHIFFNLHIYRIAFVPHILCLNIYLFWNLNQMCWYPHRTRILTECWHMTPTSWLLKWIPNRINSHKILPQEYKDITQKRTEYVFKCSAHACSASNWKFLRIFNIVWASCGLAKHAAVRPRTIEAYSNSIERTWKISVL